MAVSLALTPGIAHAHAHLVRSTPAAGSHLGRSPDRVELLFSEAPAASLTKVDIVAADGARYTVGPFSVSPPNSLLLSAQLTARLPRGAYTVSWSTVAEDDGHPSHGKFGFVVDGDETAGTASEPAAPASIGPSDARPSSPTAADRDSTSVEGAGYVLSRALNFISIIAIIGVVAFRALVVPGVVRSDTSGQSAAFSPVASRAAARMGFVGGIAALLASLGRLRAERSVVGDVDLTTLLHTFWGNVWIAQVVLAVVACIAFAIVTASAAPAVRTGAWIVAGAVAVCTGVAPAMSGHAIASQRVQTVSVVLDAVHVISAGAWLGSLLAIMLAGVPAAIFVSRDSDLAGGMPLIARTVNAFSPAALIFAVCVMATGAATALIRVGSVGALFRSTYGTVLLVKLGAVAVVLAGGAYNWLRMRRSLTHYESEGGAVAAFRRSAWIELAAGLVVVFVTAALVGLAPPMR